MADKKISELDQVLQINNDAAFPMSQDSGGTPTTYKATITQIGAEIGEEQTFSNLQTTSKNLVGAINELNQGGGGGGSSNANLAPDYDATSTYAVGDWCIYNGTLYQCNTAIPTAEAFDPTHWTAKKVVDAFADIEDELDDKVDTSDFLATNLPITSGSATNTKDYIDTGLSGKQGKVNNSYSIDGLSTPSGITRQNGGYCKIGNLVIVNVRLNLTSTVAAETDVISGFPAPVGSNNMVAVAINKDTYAIMTTSGDIKVVGNSLTYGVCVLSTAYMTATT